MVWINTYLDWVMTQICSIKMFVAENNKGDNMRESAFKIIQLWSLVNICTPVENIAG